MLPKVYPTVYHVVYPTVYHIWFTCFLQRFFPRIEANRGGRSPPLNRYKKVQKLFVKNSEKNDTDMNIKVG